MADPVTYEQAEEIAHKIIKAFPEYIMPRDHITEYEFGWVFYYALPDEYESRTSHKIMYGPAPLFVYKDDCFKPVQPFPGFPNVERAHEMWKKRFPDATPWERYLYPEGTL